MYNNSYLNKPFRETSREEWVRITSDQDTHTLIHCINDFPGYVQLGFTGDIPAIRIDSYLKTSYAVIPLSHITGSSILTFMSNYEKKSAKYSRIISSLTKDLFAANYTWPLHVFPFTIYSSYSGILSLSICDPTLSITVAITSVRCTPTVQRFLSISDSYALYKQVHQVASTFFKNAIATHAWTYMRSNYADTCYQNYPYVVFRIDDSYIFTFTSIRPDTLMQVKFVDFSDKVTALNLDTTIRALKDTHP